MSTTCRLFRMSSIVAATLLAAGVASAQADGAATTVSAAQQAARDSDRLAILRDELVREARQAEDQTGRRAGRLAVHDARGAADSEQALARHQRNIEALQREIAEASRPQVASQQVRKTAPASTRRAPPARMAEADRQEAPWWDVYGHRPGTRPAPHAEAPNQTRSAPSAQVHRSQAREQP